MMSPAATRHSSRPVPGRAHTDSCRGSRRRGASVGGDARSVAVPARFFGSIGGMRGSLPVSMRARQTSLPGWRRVCVGSLNPIRRRRRPNHLRLSADGFSGFDFQRTLPSRSIAVRRPARCRRTAVRSARVRCPPTPARPSPPTTATSVRGAFHSRGGGLSMGSLRLNSTGMW